MVKWGCGIIKYVQLTIDELIWLIQADVVAKLRATWLNNSAKARAIGNYDHDLYENQFNMTMNNDGILIDWIKRVDWEELNAVPMGDISKHDEHAPEDWINGEFKVIEREQLKLVPTKFGLIVNRNSVDPILASHLVESIGAIASMEDNIRNWHSFMLETRMYLIANDDSEEIARRTDYQVRDGKEYNLLKSYKNDGSELPNHAEALAVLQRRANYDDFPQQIKDYIKDVRTILTPDELSHIHHHGFPDGCDQCERVAFKLPHQKTGVQISMAWHLWGQIIDDMFLLQDQQDYPELNLSRPPPTE